MDISMFIILLSTGLLVIGLLARAAVLFRRARTATLAYAAKWRNDTKLSLWMAMVVAGTLFAAVLKELSASPQTVGQPASWALAIICFSLWIVGLFGSIRCLRRMHNIDNRINAERDNHST